MSGGDTEVGWITDEGVWVVPGADADALPVGTGVIAHLDDQGAALMPSGVQVLVEVDPDPVLDSVVGPVAWAGTPEQGERLVGDYLYRVLWPAPYGRSGVRPAPTQRVFDAAASLAELTPAG